MSVAASEQGLSEQSCRPLPPTVDGWRWPVKLEEGRRR